MSVYLLDTNFFIQAYRTSYPFDVVPSFWAKVKELAEAGRIISIDKVKNEIFDGEGEGEFYCRKFFREFKNERDGAAEGMDEGAEGEIVIGFRRPFAEHTGENAFGEFNQERVFEIGFARENIRVFPDFIFFQYVSI